MTLRHSDGSHVSTEELLALAMSLGNDEATLRNQMAAVHNEGMIRSMLTSLCDAHMLAQSGRSGEFALFSASPKNHNNFAAAFVARFGREPTAADE